MPQSYDKDGKTVKKGEWVHVLVGGNQWVPFYVVGKEAQFFPDDEGGTYGIMYTVVEDEGTPFAIPPDKVSKMS